jgi:hypothetical protein
MLSEFRTGEILESSYSLGPVPLRTGALGAIMDHYCVHKTPILVSRMPVAIFADDLPP